MARMEASAGDSNGNKNSKWGKRIKGTGSKMITIAKVGFFVGLAMILGAYIFAHLPR